MGSVRVLRWVLVGLTAALAVVLIVHGNVVIGVLLGAMAVTRAVMFVKMRQRREQFRQRIAERRAGRTGPTGF
jgi:hypothetical protein